MSSHEQQQHYQPAPPAPAPAEPLYCTCKRPAFGEMIACDNPSCPIEWYHFECVGIQVAPSGNWFCPPCRAQAAQAAMAPLQ